MECVAGMKEEFSWSIDVISKMLRELAEQVETDKYVWLGNERGPTPKQKEFVELLEKASKQGKEKEKRPWKVWGFVIGLNVAGVLWAIYLQSKGIDVFAFRGGS